MSKLSIRYYQWGNEKPGHVTTWKPTRNGIKHLGQKLFSKLPAGAIYDCPYP